MNAMKVSTSLRYYTADSKPLGRTFGNWTVKWWTWVYSLQRPENPIADETGELCNSGQSGKVWFLGGKPADKSLHLPVRTCTIPSDVSLLFPVINCEANLIEFPELTLDGLKNNVLEHMELIRHKECSVNGSLVPIQRVKSDPALFDLRVSEDNVFGLNGSGNTIASADGYWVFLEPLEKGNCVIKFSGSCSGGIRKSGAEYHIDVV